MLAGAAVGAALLGQGGGGRARGGGGSRSNSSGGGGEGHQHDAIDQDKTADDSTSDDVGGGVARRMSDSGEESAAMTRTSIPVAVCQQRASALRVVSSLTRLPVERNPNHIPTREELITMDTELRHLLYVVIPDRRPHNRGRPRNNELARVKYISGNALPNFQLGKLPRAEDLLVLFLPALQMTDPATKKTAPSKLEQQFAAGAIETCLGICISIQ